MVDIDWYYNTISSSDADFQCDVLYLNEDDALMRCPVDTTTSPPLFGHPQPIPGGKWCRIFIICPILQYYALYHIISVFKICMYIYIFIYSKQSLESSGVECIALV